MSQFHAARDGGSKGTPEPPAAQKALVLVPVRPASKGGDRGATRDAAARLEEAVGLGAAIHLDIGDGLIVPLATYRPATLLGSGKVAEIKDRIAADDIGLVIVDHPLTPVQQRNLEREWKAKVIDRAALILEIFGERAETREGALQVELAHLTYQRGRLVRSWTHLERQRGGFGFLGGPGETQIEADRRHIDERIARIETELEAVKRTRRLQRSSRKRASQPVIALVGYTNAGKSTLFNRLTGSDTFAENLLFATLDPTLRRISLPHGSEAVLSDTVGFISDLPTHLVAAFRATLEEVVEADLILHVRDISHPDTEPQAKDVAAVLEQLGIGADQADRMIEVWNKIDRLPDHGAAALAQQPTNGPDGARLVPVSALTGEGIPDLLSAIEGKLFEGRATYDLELAAGELGRMHRLYELGEILDRRTGPEGSVAVTVRVPPERRTRFAHAFPEARQRP